MKNGKSVVFFHTVFIKPTFLDYAGLGVKYIYIGYSGIARAPQHRTFGHGTLCFDA